MKYNKFYRCEKWYNYTKKIKDIFNYECHKCKRGENDVVLQVHHMEYIKNCLPYDHPTELCVLLCSGCHAREHGILQPTNDWILLSCDDLGNIDGKCERQKSTGTMCNKEIRYLFHSYHANFGYATFGSTCIDYMTEEDQALALSVLAIYQKSRKFITATEWNEEVTKNDKPYKQTKIRGMGIISIFNNYNKYSYGLALSQQGTKRKEFMSIQKTRLEDFNKAAMLAYLHLLALKSNNDKNVLRNMYATIHTSYQEVMSTKIE